MGLNIVQQTAALRNELDQTAAGMIVLAVCFEMPGEIGNTFTQNCDLYFRRTCESATLSNVDTMVVSFDD